MTNKLKLVNQDEMLLASQGMVKEQIKLEAQSIIANSTYNDKGELRWAKQPKQVLEEIRKL